MISEDHEAGFVHDFFFFGEIVHEILDIKNMAHIYFSWDHNQDVAILAFLRTIIISLSLRRNY